MATTLIDLIAEAEMKKSVLDPNPGICERCQEEKVTRNVRNVCPTCYLKLMNGQQGDS